MIAHPNYYRPWPDHPVPMTGNNRAWAACHRMGRPTPQRSGKTLRSSDSRPTFGAFTQESSQQRTAEPHRIKPISKKLSQRSPLLTIRAASRATTNTHHRDHVLQQKIHPAPSNPPANPTTTQPNHHPTPTRHPCRPSAAPRQSTCRPSYSRSSSSRPVEPLTPRPAVSSPSPLSTMTTTSSGGNRHFQVRHRCTFCSPRSS